MDVCRISCRFDSLIFPVKPNPSSLISQANCVAWFQWMKDIKQKKKEEKCKEMERNVRRSPCVIDIKWFYKESSSSEEERKKTKKAVPKIGSP